MQITKRLLFVQTIAVTPVESCWLKARPILPEQAFPVSPCFEVPGGGDEYAATSHSGRMVYDIIPGDNDFFPKNFHRGVAFMGAWWYTQERVVYTPRRLW